MILEEEMVKADYTSFNMVLLKAALGNVYLLALLVLLIDASLSDRKVITYMFHDPSHGFFIMEDDIHRTA